MAEPEGEVRDMAERGRSFWGWSEKEWLESIKKGAAAQAAIGLLVSICIADLDLTTTGTPSVRILGKGMKERRCPLWRKTAIELAQLVEGRLARETVFLNRRRQPLTRFGIYNLLIWTWEVNRPV